MSEKWSKIAECVGSISLCVFFCWFIFCITKCQIHRDTEWSKLDMLKMQNSVTTTQPKE